MTKEELLVYVENKCLDKELKKTLSFDKAFNEVVKEIKEKKYKRNKDIIEITNEIINRARYYDNLKNEIISHNNEGVAHSGDIDTITSSQLKEIMLPLVKEVRMKIFNSENAPFIEDIQSAVAWLEEEKEKPCKILMEERERTFKFINSLHYKSGATLNLNLIPYIKQHCTWKHYVPALNLKLDILYSYIKKISKLTSNVFNEAIITTYILTDIEPLMSRYTTKTSDGRFVLNINCKDLTNSELKNIYSYYRDGLKYKKPVNDKQEKLFSLIKEVGEPPEKDINIYWEKIKDVWNERYPHEIYKSRQGIYKLYKSLNEKINRKHSATINQREDV